MRLKFLNKIKVPSLFGKAITNYKIKVNKDQFVLTITWKVPRGKLIKFFEFAKRKGQKKLDFETIEKESFVIDEKTKFWKNILGGLKKHVLEIQKEIRKTKSCFVIIEGQNKLEPIRFKRLNDSEYEIKCILKGKCVP